MYILTINGSSAVDGNNSAFLKSLSLTYPEMRFEYIDLGHLPLFQVTLDSNPINPEVIKFRSVVAEASAIIISTPVYIHNIPAVLKSALEWLTSSGELVGKKVLAITYTPNSPRGEKAMSSLLNSLKALDSNIVASLPLYHNELPVEANGKLAQCNQLELLDAAIELL